MKQIVRILCITLLVFDVLTITIVAGAQAKKAVQGSAAASFSGTVRFDGKVPAPRKIDMSGDPACKGNNSSESIASENGMLENVFVYVKDGLNGKTFPAPKTPVVIDQNGCRYIPHVAAAMAGQPVKFNNSDAAMHNVHPRPRNNQDWNESQQPKGDPIVKTFSNPDVMFPVVCNQHPWMKMFMNVTNSPFYAVTGKDGKFALKGLPPGTYTIAAVHEKLGEQTMQVTITGKEAKTGDFTFKAQ